MGDQPASVGVPEWVRVRAERSEVMWRERENQRGYHVENSKGVSPGKFVRGERLGVVCLCLPWDWRQSVPWGKWQLVASEWSPVWRLYFL
ncbi:hypothetical protein Krac_9250 [Ktedonobacter racemifer DSM 44963]|uniref:Uncharacterized protein n=1 Tax=Ktedonobacter racemifer DSM 44963 TaxID=485913 RepID=D6TBB5_KTERA|nr:hypothetical protein Krac_9250 [Ktedonobacter racemifer DSM 44963]